MHLSPWTLGDSPFRRTVIPTTFWEVCMRPERFVVTDQIWKFYFGVVITPDMHKV